MRSLRRGSVGFARWSRAAGAGALTALALGIAAPRATGQQALPPSPAVATWPPGTAELPADPAIRFGRLDNGLRLAWLPNQRPPGRCSIRLVVHVGSLDEDDAEHGMAHFVEHMAFNGTRRFPGTSILQWFRSHGMRTGQHANAFTSMGDTTYGIDLPANDAAAIADGLDVLRQFANGVLFAPDEVDKEKGVVDAEQRERMTPAALAVETMRCRLLAGSRRAARNVLGTASLRATFTAEQLRAFHARWYRPDNMTLVLVGDLAGVDVEGLCRAAFTGFVAPATPLPPRAPLGVPDLHDTVFAIDEPGRSDVACRVMGFALESSSMADLVALRRGVRRTVAAEMARWRLHAALDQAGSPTMDFDVRTASLGDELGGIALTFRSAPDRLQTAIGECARACRDLAADEFTETLLQRVRDRVRTEIDRSFTADEQGDAPTTAQWLATCVADGETPVSPERMHRLTCEALDALTAAECAAEWFAVWDRELPAICTVGPPGQPVDAAAIWRANAGPRRHAPVAAETHDGPAVVARTGGDDWAYATAADGPLPAVERRRDAALDVEDLQFQNGVHVLIRPSSLRRGQVLVRARIGNGYALLSAEQRCAALLQARMRSSAGLERCPAARLRELAGRRARVRMGIDADAFVFEGETEPEALQFLLEWLLAEIDEPGFHDAVRDRVAAEYVAKNDVAVGSSAALMLDFLTRLVGESVGATPRRVTEVPLADVRRLWADAVVHAPITLVLVGDLDLERTVALVAQTFGRRPAAAAGSPPARSQRLVANVRREEAELPPGARASTVAVFASTPIGSVADRTRARVPMAIVQDRLRNRIREAMGATYDCQVSILAVECAHPCTLLRLLVVTEPGRETEVLTAIREELAAIAAGVTPAEIEAVRAPMRNDLRARSQDNDFWANCLGDAHGMPDALRDWARADDDLQAVDVDAVAAMAKEWFAPDRLSWLVMKAAPPK